MSHETCVDNAWNFGKLIDPITHETPEIDICFPENSYACQYASLITIIQQLVSKGMAGY
jgi:hypothetical protein